MTDQQLKALKIHFETTKASLSVASEANPNTVLSEFYEELSAKCDEILLKIDNGTFAELDFLAYGAWVKMKRALVEQLLSAKASDRFPIGGIIEN